QRSRALSRCRQRRRRLALGARRGRMAALAGAAGRRAAGRRAGLLAARGRAAAALPGTASRRPAQRFSAASRRRPRPRRGGTCPRGRLRDREDAPALRHEQAAHLHGRLSRAAATGNARMNDDDANGDTTGASGQSDGQAAARGATERGEHDPWLREALRHAPDAALAAPAALREAILAEARSAIRPRSSRRTALPDRAIAFWDWLARPAVAAGFASVMAATIVG